MKPDAPQPDDPSVESALQYADGLPADCWADRCIIELAAEVVRLRTDRDQWRECAEKLANLWRRFHPDDLASGFAPDVLAGFDRLKTADQSPGTPISL